MLERFGRLDGLAACAGVLGALTPAHQATPAIMDETVAVNFLANQRLIRALHPLLRASDAGRAVFLTSGASHESARVLGALRGLEGGARRAGACATPTN